MFSMPLVSDKRTALGRTSVIPEHAAIFFNAAGSLGGKTQEKTALQTAAHVC